MGFCGYLKQSTAVDILLGPFVDDADGKTAETGLTLDVEVSKNGQALANKNDATTPTHDAAGDIDGYYNCELDATDTNTLGILSVVAYASGALPVHQTYQVVTAHWFDTMCSTDYLQVDVIQVEGSDATDQIRDAVVDDATRIDASSINAIEAKVDTIDGIVDAILVDTGTTLDGIVDAILVDTNELQTDLTDGGRLDLLVDAILADTNELQTDDTPGALSTIEGKVDTIDGIVDAILVDTAEIGAAGAGLTAVPWNAAWDAEVQSEVQDAIEANHLDHLLAADYDPASKPGVATALLNELVENDGGVSRYTANALEEAPTGGSAPTVEEIRAEMDSNSTQLAAIVADTNELQTDLTDGGRLDLLVDAILADTNELQADDTPGALSTIEGKIDTVDGIVDAILVDTGEIGAAGAGLTAVPWNAAWDAEVQSECTDALNAYDPPTDAEMDAGFAGLNDVSVTDITQRQIPDSVPAGGTRPTIEQALYMIVQFLMERSVSGTTVTVKKVDGSTSLLTLTLDDSSDPTSITRAS